MTTARILKHGDPNRIMVRVPHIPELNTDDDVAKSKERLVEMGVKHIDDFPYIIKVGHSPERAN